MPDPPPDPPTIQDKLILDDICLTPPFALRMDHSFLRLGPLDHLRGWMSRDGTFSLPAWTAIRFGSYLLLESHLIHCFRVPTGMWDCRSKNHAVYCSLPTASAACDDLDALAWSDPPSTVRNNLRSGLCSAHALWRYYYDGQMFASEIWPAGPPLTIYGDRLKNTFGERS